MLIFNVNSTLEVSSGSDTSFSLVNLTGYLGRSYSIGGGWYPQMLSFMHFSSSIWSCLGSNQA